VRCRPISSSPSRQRWHLLGRCRDRVAALAAHPQRPEATPLSYPCQQAALASSLGTLGYLATLLGAVHLHPHLATQGRRLVWGGLGAGLALMLALLSSQAGVTQSHAAATNLPSWTERHRVSNVFAVADVPAARVQPGERRASEYGPLQQPELCPGATSASIACSTR